MHKSNGRKELSIVALGGGTGLSALLRGLKKYTSKITAIVTVSDDGGSSGTLRRELGVLPPGDIRNCLVALSEEENLMARLFQYRFPSRGTLAGHSFGNLFLTVMSSISGGFSPAVASSSEVLAVRGKVLPVTLKSVTLSAELSSGRTVKGETNIAKSRSKVQKLSIHPALPSAGPGVVDAIKKADCIILGPGSLYTSVIANLLVKGVVQAIRRSKAPKIYIANIMTQPGETSGYTLRDHIEAIEKHTQKGLMDYVIVNSGKIPSKLLRRYARKGSYPVVADGIIYGIRLIEADVVSRREYARHNSEKLADIVCKLAV
ncbi:MAG: YvcK family protein [Endomicrobiales bacterium]|nr:YvcK family protein [Endomicrobiales bacterium]